jgi:hypothetical protein
MSRPKLVSVWRREFPVEEFCRLLGIPGDEGPALFMVYAGPVGVTVKFIRRESESVSRHWERSWWSARRFCKKLGLPGSWGSHMVSSGPDIYRKNVELRFVS